LWFREASVATYCERALRAACEVEGLALEAYCFMPDHVHLLVRSDGEHDLVRLVRRFKQQTGWWFRNRQVAGGLKASPTNRHSLWQKSYYDHVLRQEDGIEDVVRYIMSNSCRGGHRRLAGQIPVRVERPWHRLA